MGAGNGCHLNPAPSLGLKGPSLGAYKHCEGSTPSASTERHSTGREYGRFFGDVGKLEKPMFIWLPHSAPQRATP